MVLSQHLPTLEQDPEFLDEGWRQIVKGSKHIEEMPSTVVSLEVLTAPDSEENSVKVQYTWPLYYTLYLSMFATTLSKHNVFRETICLTRGMSKTSSEISQLCCFWPMSLA